MFITSMLTIYLGIFSASASRVAINILSPKLDKLSFRYSKAFLLDGYEGEKVLLISNGVACQVMVSSENLPISFTI